MGSYNRRYDDEDYLIDEDIDNGYDDENDNGGYSGSYEVEEKKSASEKIKEFFGLFSRKSGNSDDYNGDEDNYDNDYDGRDEEEEPVQNSRRQSSRTQSSRTYTENTSQRRRSYDEEPTYEDRKKYDEIYGTRSAEKMERMRKTKERMNNGNTYSSSRSSSSRSSSRVTKVPEWEEYKGNVRGMLEVIPKDMADVDEIAQLLKDEYAVIVSLKNMKGTEQRVIDFIDGVSFMINYRFERIGDYYYICTPEGYMRRYELDGKNRVKRNRSNG